MTDKKGSAPTKTLYCSFCNKSQHEVRKLIAGPSVFVCDECIDLCNDIIREEAQAQARESIRTDLPTPAEIKAFLDQYVIGQTTPKRVLAQPTSRAQTEHFPPDPKYCRHQIDSRQNN